MTPVKALPVGMISADCCDERAVKAMRTKVQTNSRCVVWSLDSVNSRYASASGKFCAS